ncbi:MAG: aldehyde dehydrogenase [Armatimonadetes bacterium]|nr:MAG: aldehyde dehydrogenase [Armatimonadota bacterium]
MQIISINPSNYKKNGSVDASSENQIIQRVKKAREVSEKWRELGLEKRLEILEDVYCVLKKHSRELMELGTKEIGMPISQSRLSMESGFDYFKWYLNNSLKYISPEVGYEDEKEINKVFYEPVGVAAVIVPWNFPFENVVWGVIPNLIVGNTVVFKHSEYCPLFGKIIEEIISSSGLPEGVFEEIYGDGKEGDFLVHQDIDLIYFTGSSKTGKYLYEVAGKRFVKAVLELGGSAPGIVFQDAKIDEVLESIYVGRFYNCGQVCDGLKRLIVHKSKFEEVVDKLGKTLEIKKIGDPMNESTDFGPLVSQKQLELLKAQVQDAVDKGAKVVIGGRESKDLVGSYYEPTILTNINSKMRVWQEEVFGPVLPVVSFESEEEAVSLANDTKYGLGSYIFTEDLERAKRVASRIQAGMVGVNNTSYLKPCNPFGGYKESGMGREHGKYGLRELCQIKVVSYPK